MKFLNIIIKEMDDVLKETRQIFEIYTYKTRTYTYIYVLRDYRITTDQKMWLESLECFHFIFFSDNYFRKSFRDAVLVSRVIQAMGTSVPIIAFQHVRFQLSIGTTLTGSTKSARLVQMRFLKPEHASLEHAFEQGSSI